MFQARRQPALPETVLEAEKADGFVHVCDQSVLHFGNDRGEPTKMRPVVAVRPDGGRFVVLPCTSQDKTNFPDFIELNDKRVMWSRPRNGQKSFACSRYEVVSTNDLKGKIGVMPQPARIELIIWLRNRY